MFLVKDLINLFSWRRPRPYHPRFLDRGAEDRRQGPQGQAAGPGRRQVSVVREIPNSV